MSQKNSQSFVESDYCIRKYFDDHFAPVIDSKYKYFNEKRAQEVIAAEDSNSMGIAMGGAAVRFMTDVHVAKHGEWSSKTLDDFYNSTMQSLQRDQSIQHDVGILAAQLRATLIKDMGVERYKQACIEMKRNLGSGSSGDLATDYVVQRIDTMFVDRLAKKEMPHSSLEYIFKRGVEGSLAGMMGQGLTSKDDHFREEVQSTVEKMYNPSTGEKLSSGALSLAVDGVTVPGGMTVKAAKWTVGLTVAAHGAEQVTTAISSDGKTQTYDQYFSKVVYGDAGAVDRMQSQSSKFYPKHSEHVHVVNEAMSKKMRVPAYKALFSPTEATSLEKAVAQSVGSSGSATLSIVKQNYAVKGIRYNSKAPVPEWMSKMKETDCVRLSSHFFALAMEMKSKGTKTIKQNGKQMTFEEVSQRAYDYAHAASRKEAARLKAERQSVSASSATSTVAASQQPVAAQAAMSQSTTGATTTNMQAMQNMSLGGWESLTQQLGLSGIGDIGKNFGYVMAMLPDMLIAMFTGQSKSLQVKDNLFPIAAILGGIFVKNPLLKLMLLGLGGANLLNKAGHEALGEASTSPSRIYKKYGDEPLDSRIKDVAMKGNTMLATIDGVPQVLTISDVAVDAYYKGALPLNTLANAVLKAFDEDNSDISSNYERSMSEKEEKQRTMAVR